MWIIRWLLLVLFILFPFILCGWYRKFPEERLTLSCPTMQSRASEYLSVSWVGSVSLLAFCLILLHCTFRFPVEWRCPGWFTSGSSNSFTLGKKLKGLILVAFLQGKGQIQHRLHLSWRKKKGTDWSLNCSVVPSDGWNRESAGAFPTEGTLFYFHLSQTLHTHLCIRPCFPICREVSSALDVEAQTCCTGVLFGWQLVQDRKSVVLTVSCWIHLGGMEKGILVNAVWSLT